MDGFVKFWWIISNYFFPSICIITLMMYAMYMKWLYTGVYKKERKDYLEKDSKFISGFGVFTITIGIIYILTH